MTLWGEEDDAATESEYPIRFQYKGISRVQLDEAVKELWHREIDYRYQVDAVNKINDYAVTFMFKCDNDALVFGLMNKL